MMNEDVGKDEQGRDWLLTIPADGVSDDDVRGLYEGLKAVGVFQRERGGKTGYEHYQAFLQMESPRRWSTMKNRLTEAGFGKAHFERRRGTVRQAVDYCTKKETRCGDPVFVGDIDHHERQGDRTDLQELRDKIKGGMSVDEVLLDDDDGRAARCVGYLRELESARNRSLLGKQRWRDLDVNYLHGPTGVGKTRYVFSRYDPNEFYRITDYAHPWDMYENQHVVVFDEFAGQPTIEQMLTWLDGYTVQLPARYGNKLSSYDTVWVLSNLPFDRQYELNRHKQREAFRRRFDHVYRMDGRGILIEEDDGSEPTPIVLADTSRITYEDILKMFKS